MTSGIHQRRHANLRTSRRGVLAAVRTQRPRVQCLTNTVAQAFTANCLHAVGARASMATHIDEVVAMSTSADAVLINLGTLDDARVAAIRRLCSDGVLAARPVVLDPVFIQHSALRLTLARLVIDAGARIVKGNAAEMTMLRDYPDAADGRMRITTGDVDIICAGGERSEVMGGHAWMADVTGMGCALGAVIAAFCAVSADPLQGAHAAVSLFADAGRVAAVSARGPGSFAVEFLDALFALSTADKMQDDNP